LITIKKGGNMITKEYEDEVKEKINAYCKQQGYDWTFEEILDKYINYYSKGLYVSHTCKHICMRFEEWLLNFI
jgi:hypothetical protein